MPEPMFLLQIVYPDGTVVRFPAGGSLESNLIASCVSHIQMRPTGLLRTEAQVATAITAGITDALMALKLQTVPFALRLHETTQ